MTVFWLCQNEDVCDVTIRVSVAECVVFVLLFDFHLHCLAPAVECKRAPLPGSAKRGEGVIIQSAWIHMVQAKMHLIKYYAATNKSLLLSRNLLIIFSSNPINCLSIICQEILKNHILNVLSSLKKDIQFTIT